jgi:hypothetical protein
VSTFFSSLATFVLLLASFFPILLNGEIRSHKRLTKTTRILMA